MSQPESEITDPELVIWLRNVQPAETIPKDCLWRVIRLLKILDSVCVMQASEIAELQQKLRPGIHLPFKH